MLLKDEFTEPRPKTSNLFNLITHLFKGTYCYLSFYNNGYTNCKALKGVEKNLNFFTIGIIYTLIIYYCTKVQKSNCTKMEKPF